MLGNQPTVAYNGARVSEYQNLFVIAESRVVTATSRAILEETWKMMNTKDNNRHPGFCVVSHAVLRAYRYGNQESTA